jgi:hypothetical protein
MKIRIEAEGRLKGLRTLFMEAEECDLMTLQAAVLRTSNVAIHQIYISDLANKFPLAAKWLEPIAREFVITVERTELTQSCPDYINIVLRILNQEFWRLKKTDQIKFETGLAVKMFTVEQAICTLPKEYKGDTEVIL